MPDILKSVKKFLIGGPTMIKQTDKLTPNVKKTNVKKIKVKKGKK
jgi:hypothetical protein